MLRLAIRVLFLGICLCPGSLAATTHTLAKGDTYFSLSRKYGVSVAELQKANPGIRPASLKIGQAVQIPSIVPDPTPTPTPTPMPTLSPQPASGPAPTPPQAAPPSLHTVKKGETLTRIALQYGMTLANLKSLNALSSSSIHVGQKLKVAALPDSPATPSPTIPTPSPKSTIPAPSPTPSPTPSPSRAPSQRYLFVSPVKKQIDSVPKTGRKWKYVVIHHSGTSTGNAKIFEYYHRKVRGMENGMAYHFVVGNGSDSGDGEVEVGNRWKQQLQGGHLRSDEQNEVAIGICLVGDFNKNRPNKKQMASVIELVAYLRQRQHPQDLRFVVHRDINIRPTDCPGKLFPAQALYNLFGK